MKYHSNLLLIFRLFVIFLSDFVKSSVLNMRFL